MGSPVYLDHNATTAVDPRVVEAMLPWLSRPVGNASSRHAYGRAARAAIDEARRQVAAAVGAHFSEVLFTSGGSEANNLLVKGAAACLRPGLLAVSAIEHPSVGRPAEQLAKRGWALKRLAVDAAGRIDAADFSATLRCRPQIVSVMLANNETGVVQDVEALAEEARGSVTCFHTDAVQAIGKIEVDFRRLNTAGVRALTVSGHKMGGPQGVGALVLDKRVDLEPLIAGGGQERGLRSGTENVAAIVGFGLACQLAVSRQHDFAQRMLTLRARLELGLLAVGATLFGASAARLPNTTFFALPEVDGETLVGRLDHAGYAVASGSACSSTDPEPSHVLRAMGIRPELARGAVRVSFGSSNTAQQVDGFLSALRETVGSLRGMSAMTA